MILGLRTVIYPVTDLARGKAWYADVLGVAPYFDQPYYVGFAVGGFELGLDPDTSGVQPGNNARTGIAASKRAASSSGSIFYAVASPRRKWLTSL